MKLIVIVFYILFMILSYKGFRELIKDIANLIGFENWPVFIAIIPWVIVFVIGLVFLLRQKIYFLL